MTSHPGEATFCSISWHDVVIHRISIDRRAPGERDDVVMDVEWLDGGQGTICFRSCYAFEADLKFGVVAPETIRAAGCVSDAPRLVELRTAWGALGVALASLRCFEFVMNSTASVIRIYAEEVDIV